MQEKPSRMVESVKDGIAAAIKGGRHFSSAIVSDLPSSPKTYDGNSTVEKQIEQLTCREIEVLQLVAEGKLNKQAAAELGISPRTVEKHRHKLTSKLGIRGAVGLTHYAIYAGIIECNPQLG